MESPNGWNTWSKYVLKELERLNVCYGELKKEVVQTNIEIAKLKVKAGFWGAVGGAIPVMVAIGVWMLQKAI